MEHVLLGVKTRAEKTRCSRRLSLRSLVKNFSNKNFRAEFRNSARPGKETGNDWSAAAVWQEISGPSRVRVSQEKRVPNLHHDSAKSI